jgi:colanic acid biosynthesis protein WcaH
MTSRRSKPRAAVDPVSAALSSPKLLSDEDFARLVRSAPLVSIDLIIRNREGKVLVALRNDEPAKNYLFVPGGVILKGEPIEAAFERIVVREIGCRVAYDAARFRGVYQHFYRASRLGSESGTHYVVLTHDVALSEDMAIKLDRTHSTYRWLSEPEILASPDVHEYVKDYFRPARRTHHAPM